MNLYPALDPYHRTVPATSDVNSFTLQDSGNVMQQQHQELPDFSAWPGWEQPPQTNAPHDQRELSGWEQPPLAHASLDQAVRWDQPPQPTSAPHGQTPGWEQISGTNAPHDQPVRWDQPPQTSAPNGQPPGWTLLSAHHEQPPPPYTANQHSSAVSQIRNDPDIYGQAGTREASVNWFKATQAQSLIQSATERGLYAEWFHGIISRNESERLLGNKAVGCFLVRLGESRLGYTLSFKDGFKCRHYMIDFVDSEQLYHVVGEPTRHPSLADLVAFYQQNRLNNWDGFLTRPCPQNEGECNYRDLIIASHDETMLQNIWSTPRLEASAPYYLRLPSAAQQQTVSTLPHNMNFPAAYPQVLPLTSSMQATTPASQSGSSTWAHFNTLPSRQSLNQIATERPQNLYTERIATARSSNRCEASLVQQSAPTQSVNMNNLWQVPAVRRSFSQLSEMSANNQISRPSISNDNPFPGSTTATTSPTTSPGSDVTVPPMVMPRAAPRSAFSDNRSMTLPNNVTTPVQDRESVALDLSSLMAVIRREKLEREANLRNTAVGVEESANAAPQNVCTGAERVQQINRQAQQQLVQGPQQNTEDLSNQNTNKPNLLNKIKKFSSSSTPAPVTQSPVYENKGILSGIRDSISSAKIFSKRGDKLPTPGQEEKPAESYPHINRPLPPTPKVGGSSTSSKPKQNGGDADVYYYATNENNTNEGGEVYYYATEDNQDGDSGGVYYCASENGGSSGTNDNDHGGVYYCATEDDDNNSVKDEKPNNRAADGTIQMALKVETLNQRNIYISEQNRIISTNLPETSDYMNSSEIESKVSKPPPLPPKIRR